VSVHPGLTNRSSGSPTDFSRRLLIMASREWDFAVPDDDVELQAELRRRGSAQVCGCTSLCPSRTQVIDGSPIDQPQFFGSLSGASDLAERRG